MAVAYLGAVQTLYVEASGTPTVADAIEAYDVKLSYDLTVLERLNVAKRSLGPMQHAIGPRRGSISFKTPIRVTGTPGSAPEKEADLFGAVGFAQTYVTVYDADTLYRIGDGSATTDPNLLSCVIWFYVDGLLQKLTGCMGNLRINLPAGELGWYEWEFKGTLGGAVTAPGIDINGEDAFSTNAHQPCAGATYGIGSYDTTLTPVRSTVIDLGNVVGYRAAHTDVLNGGTGLAYITDRKPTIEIQLEEPALGTKDFWGLVLIDNPVALTGAGDVEVYVGQGANLVTIFRAQAQWNSIEPVDNDGVRDLMLRGSLVEANGELDDQLK
ncbi:MAG: hypothetical protein NUV56_00565, partial [Candidatus Uhrbacteria bacterium]|nr:hypothetical protein [Candidatus Uhrbacteria bacterium]